MLWERMLEGALTSLVARRMQANGEAVLGALLRSGELSPEEREEIEVAWKDLVDRRAREGEASEVALSEALAAFRNALGGGGGAAGSGDEP